MLPIGGLKEKLLAALRGGIETVLIPSENERELVEIPRNIKQNLDIRPVRWIDEVLDIALHHMPRPQAEEEETAIVQQETVVPEEGQEAILPH